MSRIVALLLLQAGVIPVLSQYQDNPPFSGQQYSEYGDYGHYISGNTEESRESSLRRDYPLQQSSFFTSFGKSDETNEKRQDFDLENTRSSDSSFSSTTVSSLIGGKNSYGGLTPPPPPDVHFNAHDAKHNYFSSNERNAVVPSSLRELEESYIRSLSAPPSSTSRPVHLDPYGENSRPEKQIRTPGLENYSGFLNNQNKNRLIHSHDTRSISKHQQLRQNFLHDAVIQNAPITYGLPLLNDQHKISATSNSIDIPFHRNLGGNTAKRKETGKFFNSQNKNIVPTFPDFSGPPPIPEEPDYPPGPEEITEQATRKPPVKYVFPTPQALKSFGLLPPPLAAPPSAAGFDPSFPGPILEKGFIPSFGPPTKHPFNKPLKESLALAHENNHLQQLEAHRLALAHVTSDFPTTSAVPVLRPEIHLDENDENSLPDDVSDDISDSTEKPREGRVFKHISVHVPSEDLEDDISAPKIVKVAKNPDKHIKVIFIKPPDPQTPKTLVEVPPTPQQKTLVYVLSESGGTRQPIKLVTPTPLKPAPPQVFFLRYTDPQHKQYHHEVTEAERELTSGPGPTGIPPSVHPIKQLASPVDPDAELLRSNPQPVLPAFNPFGTSSPTLSQQLHSTFSSPTLYSITSNNNFETTNDIITDPTNSKFHVSSVAASAAPATLLPPTKKTPLTKLRQNTNKFVPSEVIHRLPQAQLLTGNNNNNPFYNPLNYYSSLYHLYPPPALASLHHHNLNRYPSYFNPTNIYQEQQALYSQPVQQRQQFYKLGSTSATTAAAAAQKGGISNSENEQSSSIQGLYTVAPYLKNLPGSINFNTLIQNPDGKNLPRTTRNYAMMTYAPTYMPSASGSDHAPVFSSPADVIKSLLGDSYMYYNNTRNNQTFYIADNFQFAIPLSTTTTTTTTSTTTPVPITTTKTPTEIYTQHHTMPLFYNFDKLPNVSRNSSLSSFNNKKPQPPTIVISNDGSSYEIDETNNAHLHVHPSLATPVNPHLKPRFLTTTPSSSTTTRQPRVVSWFRSSSTKPTEETTTQPLITPSPTPNQAINVPIIIYESETGKNNRFLPNRLTTGEMVATHFDNLFSNFTKSVNDSSSSSELIDNQSDNYSGSEELTGSENAQNSSSNSSGEAENSNSLQAPIIFKSTVRNITETASSTPSPKRGKSRKRVNPALVKPGRRLRKVRKPDKSKRNKEDEEKGNNRTSQEKTNKTNSTRT